jgi:type IV fimbrial biogenesis protein FimT
MRLVTSCARRSRGVTLIELMVAITVMAILLAAAAPFLGDYITNSRMREAGNLLMTETLMAQSEAIKRNTVVRLATNAGTVQVLDMTVPATPVVLRERALPSPVTGPASTLDFGTDGRPTPFGTAAAVNLSIAGTTCSVDLRCPGLRVDAGGAVRLCGNHQVDCT